MRLFWFILVLVIILFVIDAIYLPALSLFINAGFLLAIAAVIFVSNLRLARGNLEVKVERNELGSIVGNLRDGIIAYDPDFRVLIVNRSAESILGMPGDLVGKKLSPDRMREDGMSLVIQVIFPSLAPATVRRSDAGVYPQVMDFTFSDPDLELRVTTDKITDPRGNLLGFVKLIHDRTREVRLLKSKREFISVAAHQLRTPLTAINWTFEGLRSEELNDKQKELVETGYGAAAKLLKTVNDLLDVSKIEDGRFGYAFEKADILEFLDGALKETADFAKHLEIDLYLEKPQTALPPVTIDSGKLKMAFMNLLDNAIRYNVAHGSVTVRVKNEPEKSRVIISVSDTGIGIPGDEVQKLFSKFFRASNASATAPDGSGLGLYIVRNIIRRHGGDIWVESELGRGTTFFFSIPTDASLVAKQEVVYEEE